MTEWTKDEMANKATTVPAEVAVIKNDSENANVKEKNLRELFCSFFAFVDKS